MCLEDGFTQPPVNRRIWLAAPRCYRVTFARPPPKMELQRRFCPAITKNLDVTGATRAINDQLVIPETGCGKVTPEKTATVGPRRTRYSWIGTPRRRSTRRRVDRGWSKSLKREGKKRRYPPPSPPSGFSIFIPECREKIALLRKDLPWCGRRSPVCRGRYWYLEPRIKT